MDMDGFRFRHAKRLLLVSILGWLPFALILCLMAKQFSPSVLITPVWLLVVIPIHVSASYPLFWIYLVFLGFFLSCIILPFIHERWTRLTNVAIGLIFLLYFFTIFFIIVVGQSN